MDHHQGLPRWPALALVAALVVIAVLLVQSNPSTEPPGDGVVGEVDGGDGIAGEAGDAGEAEPSVPEEAAEEAAEAPDDAADEDPAGLEAGEETGQPDAARAGLEGVLAALRENPEAHGDRADDLEENLEDVLDEDGAELNSGARELMTDIEKWMDEGRLDPELGQQVIGLLQELTR